ncbi:DUF5348 domain-containing protein [Schinkia azotoformans]|uniref:DUF5348 domain-containing protein n=1 Tax=Schinkia azotoformans TaxID=1454 RepID=UPI002E200F6A|nr:DUF5348 domain-containing protein [Schinkia azotoformans]
MRYAHVRELDRPLFELKDQISSVLYKVDHSYENIEYDRDNEEDVFLTDEFRRIIDKLCQVENDLNYLKMPITEVGVLRKNELGRYETANGTYFTSGSPIEAYIYDSWDEIHRWVKSRIEHKNGDYYLYGHDDVKLAGLKVRIRG